MYDILQEYTLKNKENKFNPVAIGKYGIRTREEIYGKDLSANYSKNKIIFKDTLTIGMGSTQIDIGVLLEDRFYSVSPAYTTFKIININPFYLNEFLKEMNALLSQKYMIIGARQGKSVNKKDLLKHKLSIHSIKDQENIAMNFTNLYNIVKYEKSILASYNKTKRYLINKLFI